MQNLHLALTALALLAASPASAMKGPQVRWRRREKISVMEALRTSWPLAFGAVLVALSCAGTPTEEEPDPSRVLDYGPDRYFVAHSSMLGASESRTAAIRDANAFCEAQGGKMVPEESERSADGLRFGFELVFRCDHVAKAQGSPAPEQEQQQEPELEQGQTEPSP